MRATLLLCLISLALTVFPQQSTSERTVTLIIQGQEETVKESEARAEYDELVKAGSVNTPRFAALTLALGTTPQQAKCITWDQHVAEVTSWWAAPERVYVPCDDPRVGAPKGN